MHNPYEDRAKSHECSLLAIANADVQFIRPKLLRHVFEFAFILGTAAGHQRRWHRGVRSRLRICIVVFGFGFHVEAS